MFCLRLFHGCTIRRPCLLLRAIYTGNVFLSFRRCLCSPSRIFLHVYLFVIVLAYFVSVGCSESCLTFVGAYFSLIFTLHNGGPFDYIATLLL